MTFSATTYTAPSGAFASTTGSYQTGDHVAGSFVSVYNPTVLDKYTSSYEKEKPFEFSSDELTAAIKKYSTPINAADFDTYGEKLVDLTHQVISFAPHCSLGPLRGAAKPCVMAEVMSRGACEYEFFNFQENSNKARHPRIFEDLKEIISRRDPGEEIYRINITDAARGGHGINNLVGFLSELKTSVSAFKNQKWKLDLNLVHDQATRANLAKIQSVRDLRLPGFDIDLHCYTVPNLIVEDFDPALAFELEWDGQRHIFKPCSVPGQFLYQTGNQVSLIQSDNSYLTFEELYSRAITEHLTTAPNLQQVGVVWNEYQTKG